ncbi:conserved unknown protein [Ectocarpus siliculosus]|uniref:Hsp70-Hsp90 organising protein n=1 Tax=Ectocarpus siliculosus TaxID=2880 RepID=D7FMZ5_ECTSI|nr:conserved unknown protein [Ectocarpus siliculosus]|eukprot:CBJ30059.1 conserved unknown protein [Ectocarpus siliculosus]
MSAQEWKDKGNAALKAGDFEEAISSYTKAIDLDPSNHVFFSNRSAAHLSNDNAEQALADAESCIKVNGSWAKGFTRKGAALHKLKRYEEAAEAYEEGLETSPGDAALGRGLQDVLKAKSAASKAPAAGGMGGMGGMGGNNPIANAFGSDMMARLAAEPKFVPYLADPSFVAKLKMLQQDPNNMQMHLSDPRIMEVFGFLLGIDLKGMSAGAGGDEKDGQDQMRDIPTPPQATPQAQAEAKPAEKEQEEENEEKADPDESEEEAAARKKRKADQAAALVAKKKGNELYSAKNFPEALEAYGQAIELDNTNMSFLSNRAAVFFEQKEYEACIAECKKAVGVGRVNRAGFADIGKAYARMAKASSRMGDKSQAIAYLEDAQMEMYTKENERLIKTLQLEARKEAAAKYVDPEKALEAKERGNEQFRAGQWALAISEYEEAVKRDPTNAAYRNNLAAALTKIGDFNAAKAACEKALELDSKYVKAWAKKGDIEFFMKEYHKALDSYKMGLTVEPNNSLCVDGVRKTTVKINEGSGKADSERAAHAMADPEIQMILTDPVVRQVLNDFKDNPKEARKALGNADMRAKIDKLVAAGVVQVA